MIVTCQNCDTSFQLDESRVPAQGIRVRCSRCKEAFFLAKPSVDPDQAIHGIAAEAARSAGSRSPTATRDLGASTAIASPPGKTPTRAADEEEEHDWEFNLDPPAHGSAAASKSSGSADGNLAFEGADEGGSGLSLEGEDETAESLVIDEPSAFGSVDDFSSLMEGDTDQVDVDAGTTTRISTADRSAERGKKKAGKPTAAGRKDELGDPENWDFFGDQPSPVAESTTGSVLGRIALASVPANPDLSAASAQAASEWDDDPYDDASVSTGTGKIERSILWLGQAVGWATTALLASVVMVSGFWTTAQSLVVTPQEIRFGPFEARDVTGSWIDTTRGETLLRVTGRILHPGGSAVALGGLLEIRLLDADGGELRVDPQAAGIAIPAAELRELTPAAMRIVLDRAAFSLSQQPIAPSDTLMFQAIFRDVPGDAVRFALSIAERPANTGGAIDGTAQPMTVEAATALDPGDAVEATAAPNAQPADDLTWGE